MSRLNSVSYENAVLMELKKKYPKAITSPSFLRMEEVLQNGKNLFQFKVLNVGNESSTEVKLDKADSFFVTKLSLFLTKRDKVLQDEVIQPLQTYPNETFFAPVANVFVPSHMEAIYNAKLNIKKNSSVVLEKYPTKSFRDVPTTQQTSASNKSEINSSSAKELLNPTFSISGGQQVEISLDVPSFANMKWAADPATNLEHRMVMMLEGFLVKGVNVIDR